MVGYEVFRIKLKLYQNWISSCREVLSFIKYYTIINRNGVSRKTIMALCKAFKQKDESTDQAIQIDTHTNLYVQTVIRNTDFTV